MYTTYNGCSNDMAAKKKQPQRVPTFILIAAILSKQHNSQRRTQSIFGDTVYSWNCKLRLVTPHGGG